MYKSMDELLELDYVITFERVGKDKKLIACTVTRPSRHAESVEVWISELGKTKDEALMRVIMECIIQNIIDRY